MHHSCLRTCTQPGTPETVGKIAATTGIPAQTRFSLITSEF